MDSKRDIRPKLASRLLKDSLVLHCLFRVSLATQHIIGTIIFLKQRKTRIRITSSLNLRALGRYVVRMYERARVRSPCAPSPSLLTARPVAVTSGSPALGIYRSLFPTRSDYPTRLTHSTIEQHRSEN